MKKSQSDNALSRRRFIQYGGAILAGSTALSAADKSDKEEATPEKIIKQYRTLGRTGFKVSDIGFGTGQVKEGNVIRYAYDQGINYFDTAEVYAGGESERSIGEAMTHMNRKKIFVTTKLAIKDDATKESILERFGKCQERLKTDYIDALYTHAVQKADVLKNPAFHEAVKELKADGRLKYIGFSTHGPHTPDGESMEKVVMTGIKDGRFDLFLMSYNLMNQEISNPLLKAANEKNLGTTAMKIAPHSIEIETFDPENLTKQQQRQIDRAISQGTGKEEALKKMQEEIEKNNKETMVIKGMMKEQGLETLTDLRKSAVQWVLSNPEMHTICVTMSDYATIDTFAPLSGTSISSSQSRWLERFAPVSAPQTCAIGCDACLKICPKDVAANNVMRYLYYFSGGREKEAMQNYASLGSLNGSLCLNCDGACQAVCPQNIAIQQKMTQADRILTLA